MAPLDLILASRNEGKARELERLLATAGVRVRPMSDLLPASFEVEETGATFEDNAWLKASAVCAATSQLTIADDSGLEVDALGGAPGVHSARFAGPRATDDENNALLLERLGSTPWPERTARFRCVLVLAAAASAGVVRVASSAGVLEGRVTLSPRGQGGFGYDSVFEPNEFPGLTTAEISMEQKNGISHRGRAAVRLAASLRDWAERV